MIKRVEDPCRSGRFLPWLNLYYWPANMRSSISDFIITKVIARQFDWASGSSLTTGFGNYVQIDFNLIAFNRILDSLESLLKIVDCGSKLGESKVSLSALASAK